MDTQPVIIGFGPKSRYRKPAPSDAPSRRHFKPELVDVYIMDEFIEAIPRRVLIRFSIVAAKTFPRPVNPGNKIQAAPTTETSDRSQSPRDSGYHGSPGPAAGHRARASPVQTSTIVTSPLHSSAPKGRKQLKLYLDAPEMPSYDAVQTALKWMKDNADADGSARLLDYGPSSLEDAQLIDLIDLYQTALCFDIRPFPKRIRIEILSRLTNNRPDVNTFAQLSRFLPIDDSAIARAINSFHDFWRAKEYTSEEMSAFSAFLDQEQNKDFERKLSQIFKARRVAHAKGLEDAQGPEVRAKHPHKKGTPPPTARHAGPNVSTIGTKLLVKQDSKAEPKQENVTQVDKTVSKQVVKEEGTDGAKDDAKEGTKKGVKEGSNTVADEATTETPSEHREGSEASPGGRRRPRRAQQARGKALEAEGKA
ncbi:unnamed protein product [Zymoseptoria tritici ST99CH_3D1]|uniref:Uncharacterized protein n=1 Tax=Zymoseptoria tritici ST99CH_1E4 TaxID=1276532 RepID=A0A2H1G3T3_ZYMTR|nr:unnamed protein product [Zymoseptoria tritici ST99CH_1E4]SMR49557.1 unnamed protein product [Zymoseptoria tritici ST99CH_3D1]